MKLQFKKTPIALALAAMFLSPIAFATDGQDGDDHHDRNHDPVKIEKDLSLEQDVEIKGHVHVGGNINVDASSIAIVNDAQITHNNEVTNQESTNDATVNGNALQNASGNIGLNVTAGDNNQQANAAAISAADASFVFGSSDAEVFALQAASHNSTYNNGQTNSAHLDGNALQNAAGNIGVNISAGNSNQQKNDMAASVAVARLATATVGVTQYNGNNSTTNNPVHREEVVNVPVSLALNAGGGYLGFGGGTYSGTHSGTSSGTSDQIGDLYPDTWSSSQLHPCSNCSQTGHIDLDSAAQGAQDLNDDGGALAFNNDGTYSGRQSGGLGFIEAGGIALSGTVSGNIPVVVAVNLNTTNTSHLGDNALQGAKGNIGVNIASGTNNQQFNGLAISATQAGTTSGGGSETPR